MKKIYLLALFVAILISCNKHQTFEVDVKEIKIAEYKEIYTQVFPSYIFGKEEFVPLERINDENYFSHINKLIVSNNKIFILDKRKKSIFIFMRDGGFFKKIGENKVDYDAITDFDIDKKNGNIYLIDGKKDQFLTYDSNFKLINKMQMPFEADIVKLVENDNFLFGVSSWFKGKEKGSQIILVDRKLKVIKTILKYDEYKDDEFWIHDYNFTSSRDFIFYNKSISDNVIKLDKSGQMREVFHFDFGSKMVPFKERMDIEANMYKFNNYRFLLNLASINENYFFGELWDKKNKIFFLLDRSNKNFYLIKNKPYNYLNNYISLYEKSLISYIGPGEYKDDKYLIIYFRL